MIFGGTDADDAGVAIVTNGSNDAYVTGYVNSTNFPTTPSSAWCKWGPKHVTSVVFRTST
jgi:hypothetical protein